jgi:hypothetical protein
MYTPKTTPEIPLPSDISERAQTSFERIVPDIDRKIAGQRRKLIYSSTDSKKTLSQFSAHFITSMGTV